LKREFLKLSKLKLDYPLIGGIAFLLVLSVIVLRPIAPFLFPLYYVYIFLAVSSFLVFQLIDFDVLSFFSKHFYVATIFLLLLALLIGRVTRGAIRWIPIGPLTIQPAEIARPFLLVFFANYLTQEEVDVKRLLKAIVLLILPLFLIVIQPSLGVTFLTAVGFLGIIFATNFKKKYLVWGVILTCFLIPLIWMILQPYQRTRILTFLEPMKDPLGAGYNSIQSMISVGSGKIFGRGLGRGVQTQLAFLPERHTDFIFASVAEELGFVGALLLIAGSFFIFTRLTSFIENAESPAARAYVSGLFLTLFVQTIVHIGMNMGMLPITGVPYPLVSAGGSSLLATMIGLGIASRVVKR
jgi:rod shape determining protein RodA